MRVLVTGGSGFIGTAVVSHLVGAGISVTNLDVAPPRDASQNQYWVPGDVLRRESLRAVCSAAVPTHCIHLAAETELLASDNIERDYPVNASAAPILMEELARVECTRLVAASTQYVRGPQVPPSDDPDSYAPHTPYGRSKVLMELQIKGSTIGLPWTIVRPTYVWGPWHLGRFLDLARALRSRRYLHPSGAPVIRSYGYVTNVADQLVHLLEVPGAVGETLYAGEEPVDSRSFVDDLSVELSGRRARSVPRVCLWALAEVGEITSAMPLDRFRYRNLTTNYPVPMARTFAMLGQPRKSRREAAGEYAAWLDWFSASPRS